MIYFSPPYLIKASLVLLYSLSSRLAGTLPTEQNTNNNGITKAGNDLSKFTTPSVLAQDPSVTSKYSNEEIKAIVEAASSKHSDDVIKQLMLAAGYSYTGDIEHETLVDGKDLEYLFAKPDANNPDTVHHRSARGAGGIEYRQKLDLGNGNCFIIGLSKQYWNQGSTWDTIYTKCVGENCIYIDTPDDILNSQGIAKAWSAYIIIIDKLTAINNNTAEIKYSYMPPASIFYAVERTTTIDAHNCNEPPTAFSSHMKKADDFISNALYEDALAEVDLALNEHPSWRADFYKESLLKALAKTTTAKPSSSTPVIDETSTHTATKEKIITETSSSPLNISTLITNSSTATNSTPTENPTLMKNTTLVEDATSSFHTPTAVPNEQNTEGWGGYLLNNLGKGVTSAVATIAGVIFMGTTACVLYKIKQCCDKLKEASHITKDEHTEKAVFYTALTLQNTANDCQLTDDYTDNALVKTLGEDGDLTSVA